MAVTDTLFHSVFTIGNEVKTPERDQVEDPKLDPVEDPELAPPPRASTPPPAPQEARIPSPVRKPRGNSMSDENGNIKKECYDIVDSFAVGICFVYKLKNGDIHG